MTQEDHPAPPKVYRHGKALLDARVQSELKGNLCTPSVVTIPDWARARLPDFYGSARVACYFAHHTGRGIRLALAEAPEGPWQVASMEAPALADTPFGIEDPLLPQGAGQPDWIDVSTPDSRWRSGLTGSPDGPPWRMVAHVASPDVHVDAAADRFWMTYHGLLPDGGQATRLATSVDGVTWETGTDQTAPLLGPPYFRGFFGPDGFRYALVFQGGLMRAANPEGPYEVGPVLVPPDSQGRAVRHIEGLVRGETLHLFYSRIGDAPELIYHATAALSGPWHDWTVRTETVLVTPEAPWEGADQPVTPSKIGTAPGLENALRDPCIYEAPDGRCFLYYCGGGEQSLCLAELVWSGARP